MIVTGIGSRQTPEHVLSDMRRIGAWCRRNKIGLRSGHAEGADWAFEQGAQEFCICYLPWSRFNRELVSEARIVPFKPSPEVDAILKEIHPAADKLADAVRLLHGRNVWQILGMGLSKPSDVVVCWTPDGKTVGGTATAIRLAEKHGIPVFNLAVTGLPEVLTHLQAIRDRLAGVSSGMATTPIAFWFVRQVFSRSRNRWAGALMGLDPNDEDRVLKTTPIVKVEGRIVTTRSGTRYELVGPTRFPRFYPATEDNPIGTAEPGGGFYLDTEGDEIWPPGATLPEPP